MSRTQSLLYAVALMSVCAVFFRILYVGSRLPRERWWIGERWLCDVWMPILIIAFSFGVDFGIAATFGKGALITEGLPLLYATIAITVAVAAWILLGRLLPRSARHDGVDGGPPPLQGSGATTLRSVSMRPTYRRAA